MATRRHVNIVWGLVLVAVAAVLLLRALGNIPDGIFDIFTRALPALLVFAGLTIILPPRIPLGGVVALGITGILIAGLTVTAFSRQTDVQQDGQQLEISQSISQTVSLLQVNIETLATDVEVRVGDADGIISGEFIGTTESDITQDYVEDADGRATYSFIEAPRSDFPMLDAIGRSVLRITLPPDLPLALAFAGEDGETLLDMSSLSLERISVTLDDGNAAVTLPEYMPQSPNAVDQPGIITVSSGDLTIFVPEDVAARFELNRQGSGIDPQFNDSTYLYLVGDVLEARDYEDADLRLRYVVTVPAGQITLETVP